MPVGRLRTSMGLLDALTIARGHLVRVGDVLSAEIKINPWSSCREDAGSPGVPPPT
jgi:hypothetical protein